MFDTAIRVGEEVAQTFAQVQGRYIGYFQHGTAGSRRAKYFDGLFPGLAGFYHFSKHFGLEGIWITYVDFNFFCRRSATTRGHNLEFCDTCPVLHLDFESSNLIRIVAAEAHALITVFNRHQACTFAHFDLYIADFGIGDKYVNRQLKLIARRNHPRQGRANHERIAYGNTLIGSAVGIVLGGYHHHPHCADVVGYFDLVLVGAAFGQLEWPETNHHGFEAVGGIVQGTGIDGTVATNAEDAFHFTGKSTEHFVVNVPGLYTQGFASIKNIVRIGRFEAGQPQQTFVNHGQTIGHGFARFFTDADTYGRFWPELCW